MCESIINCQTHNILYCCSIISCRPSQRFAELRARERWFLVMLLLVMRNHTFLGFEGSFDTVVHSHFGNGLGEWLWWMVIFCYGTAATEKEIV